MLRMVSIARIMLVAAVFLTAGCQPVRPLAQAPEAEAAQTAIPATEATVEAATAAATVEPSAVETATVEVSTETPTETPVETPGVGAYDGKLSIAGMDLDIVVKLAGQDSGGAVTYSGTIDIPQQAATGIPLHDITVDGAAVHFEMLAGPQTAKFDGEIASDGTISGKMTQSGYEGTFSLAPQQALEAAATATASGEEATPQAPAKPLPAGVASMYTDPAGLFSVPVPTSWTVSQQDGYALLSDPEDTIKVYLLTAKGTDIDQALAAAWKTVDPTFALEVEQAVDAPSAAGIEQTKVLTYRTGDSNRVVQAQGRLKDGTVYIDLYDVQMAGVQKRAAQLGIISSGFKILAQQQVDLSSAQPLTVTTTITEELEAFIDKYMAAFEIPGAAVGIVQNGQLVYAQGFGEANPETGAPMTPDTRMMIGSTGKSLTTMMMATLVDDGLMSWDTPVIDLFPSFKVKDPELTKTITMRNLVCACTGVPRRDMEWLFNSNHLTPKDTVAALADFEFYTKFGEAFQYSNQMVATAGYIAGQVAESNHGDLGGDYAKALQARVLDPIGMISTTLSFEQVEAEGNYAIPHTAMLDRTYAPISLDVERFLQSIGPAGAHWSTLNDMARYMITQLADGVAPDGKRVVSAENLNVTRKPQIAINANASYGLGWMITSYHGQPVITHAGNTLGFTSEFTFLPQADLGVIVLTNAQGSNLFNGNVTTKLLELVFEQEPQVEKELDFIIEQLAQQTEKVNARLGDSIDEVAVKPFLGSYTNPVLGDAELALKDGKLLLDVGEFVADLRPYNDPDTQFSGYIQVSPPGQGLTYRLVEDDAGQPQIIFGQGAEEYTFTRK